MSPTQRTAMEAAVKALTETQAWTPDGSRLTPAQRGAECETAHDVDVLVTAAKDAIEDALAEPDWLPIAEAPQDGKPFDAWNGLCEHRTADMKFDKQGRLRFADESLVPQTRLKHYTHYMPAPAPPKGST